MELKEYQEKALETDLSAKASPEGIVIAVLGLVSEAGSIANVVKKYLRDGISQKSQSSFIQTELGDVLWYLSNVASRLGLSLDEIAQENLRRTQGRHRTERAAVSDAAMLRLDQEEKTTERFPDVMVFNFRQVTQAGDERVQMIVTHCDPNPFPTGALTSPTGKKIGFKLGDPLNDNTNRNDGYRYHDAIHIGFMAVLGWSPVLRRLLRIKRKSKPDIDNNEDGARAGDVEEGLATFLAQRAPKFENFERPQYVDNETLDHILEHANGLEVMRKPPWMWKDAISQGFCAMKHLFDNGGGFLTADLRNRSVTYSKLAPTFESMLHGGEPSVSPSKKA